MREFSLVWYALAVTDVTYVIVKVYDTERNDVIKRHTNVIQYCGHQQPKLLHHYENTPIQI